VLLVRRLDQRVHLVGAGRSWTAARARTMIVSQTIGLFSAYPSCSAGIESGSAAAAPAINSRVTTR
jgi:hypothetical protein